ncbi:hypothetical protein KL919_001546 [Ogataea angusta]|uniref:UDENN FLCN/SMCR8-type domain-containing protein n=2 Tax=Pichia angusta TaxID=870730 RepID=A0ABQ7RXW9_PICAN|nr:hypothetical protein KL940_002299 [Ogataea angusta]KAG7862416.1 hypothetical protein KL919_001546 [Ogataea angusta]
MSFMITLAHFCEVHGPSMVICTQNVHSGELLDSYYGAKVPPSSVCKSCEFIVPQESTSLRTQSGDQIYISTQHPSSQPRYAALRQTIMRVFTIESNHDMNKPLSFGDSKNGYSVSLGFKLIDDTARGSERRYSLIFTCDSEQKLYENYSVILDQLIAMVKYITTRSMHIIGNRRKNENNNETYLRRGSRMPKIKSIIELLQDDNFFVKLHLWASSLLDQL